MLKADATKESEQIKGEGDAKSNTTLATAFAKDADFFAFYQSMKAYEASLSSKDTRLLLSPDSDFFKYFADPNGGKPQAVK